jgi:hypothetical protein
MSATTRTSSSAPQRKPPRPPVSQGIQRLILAVGALVAIGAVVLAAVYQADTDPSPVLTGSPADGGGVRPDDPNAARPELNISPVEGWFPRSGQGSTCSEPVGVDLIPGYAATLIINGQTLTAEQLNAPDSAARSLGRYTYGPEPDCPNGALLRPVGNVVQACVYRVDEEPDRCQLTQPFRFDAL